MIGFWLEKNQRTGGHGFHSLRKNSRSLNILEGARLQARRMSFDLNNGGAESPAPSKPVSSGGEFFSSLFQPCRKASEPDVRHG